MTDSFQGRDTEWYKHHDLPTLEVVRHWFVRRDWWWLRRKDKRYICVQCNLVTRHYDSLDRWMSRPVHVRMSVAYKGVNTIGRAPQ